MPRRGIDLSEEQWRNVKALAAKRGQTISAWFGDVIMEMGIGRASGKEYPSPVTPKPLGVTMTAEDFRVASASDPSLGPRAQQASRDAILRKINRGG